MSAQSNSNWPANIFSDYSKALVRSASLLHQKKQHLLYGCVELLPPEIPKQTEGICDYQSLAGSTLVVNVAEMAVQDALCWYESALTGAVSVPGVLQAQKIHSGSLAAYPNIGILLLAEKLPMIPSWHSGTRFNRLVALTDAEDSIAELMKRDDARKWFERHLNFDLLAYDDWLYGLALLAPNPFLRSCDFSEWDSNSSGDIIRIETFPRQGAALSNLAVHLTSRGIDGHTMITSPIDPSGITDLTLPQTFTSYDIEIFCPSRGPLYQFKAGSFIHKISVTTAAQVATAQVNVPPRKKNQQGYSYVTPVYQRSQRTITSPATSAQPADATLRLGTLYKQRINKTGEQRPETSVEQLSMDEFISLANTRQKSVAFVKQLIENAQKQVVIVDPFFGSIDLAEFALANVYTGVSVSALIDSRNLKQKDADGVVPGQLLFDSIQQIAPNLTKIGKTVPEIKQVNEMTRKYHDRFLVIDDDVWHLGHSLNQIGMTETSMLSKLRLPTQIKEQILEDLDNADDFIAVWPQIKGPDPTLSEQLIRSCKCAARCFEELIYNFQNYIRRNL
ncbi:MAG TPA: VPA1262 family N-terminal domain-containing protein [Oculatellaceae cyanobacterium]